MSELLVTIDRASQLTELRTLMSALTMRRARYRVVALELDIFEQLQSEQIRSVYIDDLVDAGAYDGIDAEAFELAHGWFRGDDPTFHDGISLGRLVAWEMTYFLAEALRCSRNVDALLEAMCPGAVLVLSEPVSGDTILLHPTENFHHDALRAVCARRGIPCELSAPLPESVAVPEESGARPVTPSPARPGHRSARSLGKTVLTLSTQSVTPVLAGELFRRGIERLLVLGDPGVLGDGEPRVSQRSLDPSVGSAGAAEARARFRRVWRRRGETILETISDRAPSLRGFDCLKRRLHRLFDGYLAAAYGGFLKHRQLLVEENVGAVLLHNDVTEPGCSMALAAKREGVASLVLLHGAVGHPIGALPVSADRVWGLRPAFVTMVRG